MIAAVSGYMGSGKTTVAEILHEHGFSILVVDEIAHRLVEKPEIRDKIKAVFGKGVLERSLMVDRQKLARAVFRDELLLKKLNEIMHPFLKESVREGLGQAEGDIVVDAALFYELSLDRLAQATILVTADIELVYGRLRPQYSKEEILTVINSQRLPKDPDFIIENNSTKEALRGRVQRVASQLKERGAGIL